MDCPIIHLPNEHRFETTVDGHLAYAIYQIADGSLNIAHTSVPGPIEGKGIAAALVKETYAYALESNLEPLATCPYAEMWLIRHPEYQKS